MKYAVIQIGSKQYKVSEGQQITLDLQEQEPGDKLTFSDVLLKVDGDQIELGTPTVKSAKVTATLDNHLKGKKVRVAKFKSKSRYRKVNGFRASLSSITINKIS